MFSLKAAISRFLPCKLFVEEERQLRWSQRYIAVMMVLISWCGAAGLKDRFAGSRQTLAAMFPGGRRCGRTYQGLIVLRDGRNRQMHLLTSVRDPDQLSDR